MSNREGTRGIDARLPCSFLVLPCAPGLRNAPLDATPADNVRREVGPSARAEQLSAADPATAISEAQDQRCAPLVVEPVLKPLIAGPVPTGARISSAVPRRRAAGEVIGC